MQIPNAPAILAALDILGEATTTQLATKTNLRQGTVQAAVANMTDAGILVICGRETGSWCKGVFYPNTVRNIYRRAIPIAYPELGASEYLGWHPTGTPSDRCKVSVLRGWGR